MIQIKRVYEKENKADGYRVLIDRLWPRGIKKESLRFDEWIKDLAPSTELRKEFGHDPEKWSKFITSYKGELKAKPAQEALQNLVSIAKKQTLTLLYSAKDEEHNNAVVLKELLDSKIETLKARSN